MWISPDGSADLYTSREESGAVQGEPIHLGPNVARAEDNEPVPKGESAEEILSRLGAIDDDDG